ncbi:class I SAM-dependent methyltransferase [Frankia sp. B2]|nr:class I SAM-dependent methyltransferase [Frankia sp. B2]
MRRRGWLPVAACVGIGLNSIRLRGRVGAIDVIESVDHGPPGGAPGSDDPHAQRPPYVLLLASGVRLGPEHRRAADAYARRHGCEVLDLVPAEMSAHRILDLARMVDPSTYRSARLARGRGAFQAVLVDAEVLARTGLTTADSTDLTDLTDLTEAELVAVLETCKRHAAASTDLAVLPGLVGAEPDDGRTRLSVHRAAYAWEPARRVLPALRDAAILLGATSNPLAALAAVTMSWLQPVAVGGSRLWVTPGTLRRSMLTRRRGALLQLVGMPSRTRDLLGAPTIGPDPATCPRAPRPIRTAGRLTPTEIAEKRSQYRRELAGGLDRFLESPRTTCPWCGGNDLSVRMNGRDVSQGKPGRFRYDRCGDCGHVFQNPRLSFEGLDFYYRDFYDGLGAAMIEEVFGFSPGPYLHRASLSIPTPRRWLDVGGGHGHFCNVARTVWPTTSFDALDIGAGIEEAERRRWVDRAYRGLFPDIAADLADQYDVISMFHYLEHTRDPLAELDAAALALAPGRHLLLEVPNPESPAARMYRQLWPGWLIPQHQHLMPAANLAAALSERGFAVQEIRFGDVHQRGDPVMALYGLLQTVAPSPSSAWRTEEEPGRPRRVRALTAAAMVPAFVAGLALDAMSRPYLTAGSRSNAYRILARRR